MARIDKKKLVGTTTVNTVNNSDKEELYNEDKEINYVQAMQEYSQTRLKAGQRKAKYSATDIIISNLSGIYDDLVQGKTVTYICNKYGIHRSSWYCLAQSDKHFQDFLTQVEQEQLSNVRQTLVNKCQDKYIKAQKVLPNGKVVEYLSFIPADTNAVKFYLLNKASDEYKEKQEVTVKQTNIVVDIIDDTDYTVVANDDND